MEGIATMESNDYIQFFDGGIEPKLENLGGKGASLVAMTSAGMPVPPGFVVTTAQFDAFMAEAGITRDVHRLLAGLDPENTAQVDKVSAAIREDICSRPVPQALRQLTVGAYDFLMSRFDAPVPVAVRSSATAEDLPDASFAGQQDTYLWLDGVKAVTEHIRQCWASLFTSRAIIYRLKNHIPNQGLSMAVVVQKMVNSKVSGVAITMDPTNGDRSKITIDSSYGLGEMVVSGQVTPDNIMLDKVTLAPISEHLGDKHAELVPDPGAGRLVEREVDAERRARRSLSDAELTAVAQMAKRAEKHFRCPQDIEWAIDADLPDGANVLLLQSRPETVHSSKPIATPAPLAPTPAFSLGSITASLLKPSA
jgi:pyruvate,water dikinase